MFVFGVNCPGETTERKASHCRRMLPAQRTGSHDSTEDEATAIARSGSAAAQAVCGCCWRCRPSPRPRQCWRHAVLRAPPPASGGSSTSSPAAATAGSLKTATIGGATVLTNSKGFTLYSFAPDTATKSNCNAGCVQYWPPVKGPATASGVTGTLRRSSGRTARCRPPSMGTRCTPTSVIPPPGRPRATGSTSSGGVWHEVTASGGAPGRELVIGLQRRRLRVLTGPDQAHAED